MLLLGPGRRACRGEQLWTTVWIWAMAMATAMGFECMATCSGVFHLHPLPPSHSPHPSAFPISPPLRPCTVPAPPPPSQAAHAAFVLVAGGLGERLGYSGIKVALPVECATDTCFLQLYCQFILALQACSAALLCCDGCYLRAVRQHMLVLHVGACAGFWAAVGFLVAGVIEGRRGRDRKTSLAFLLVSRVSFQT
eukprot:121202-Chlamydomonas_euryale.AAC.4